MQLALGKNHDAESQRNSSVFIEQVRTFRHKLLHVARVEIHQLRAAPVGAFEFPNQLNDVIPHTHTPLPDVAGEEFLRAVRPLPLRSSRPGSALTKSCKNLAESAFDSTFIGKYRLFQPRFRGANACPIGAVLTSPQIAYGATAGEATSISSIGTREAPPPLRRHDSLAWGGKVVVRRKSAAMFRRHTPNRSSQ